MSLVRLELKTGATFNCVRSDSLSLTIFKSVLAFQVNTV